MSAWMCAAMPQTVLAGLFDTFALGDDGSVTFGWVLGRVLLGLVVIVGLMSFAAIVVWAERRVSAWMQDRRGPNRVGPFGLLQPLADLGKFIFKEDVVPGHVNRWIYIIAPVLSLIPAMVTFAVIPYTGSSATDAAGATTWASFQVADLNIGILYILAITSLGVYGITLGGWSSNSKYSLLGGVRSSAQMISYELSLGLAVVAIVLTAGSLHLGNIVAYQADTTWFVFQQPLAFFLFVVAAYAETNRLPFDFPEAEQEIVAGYHTEYSSMKFAFFFLAEYINLVVASALIVTLFCGGWTLFGLEQMGWLAGLGIFLAKTLAFVFIFLWVRWTLPRFRYDQLMAIGWAWFIPLGLINVVITASALAFMQPDPAADVARPWVPWVLPFVVVGAALLVALLAGGRREKRQQPLGAAVEGSEGDR